MSSLNPYIIIQNKRAIKILTAGVTKICPENNERSNIKIILVKYSILIKLNFAKAFLITIYKNFIKTLKYIK